MNEQQEEHVRKINTLKEKESEIKMNGINEFDFEAKTYRKPDTDSIDYNVIKDHMNKLEFMDLDTLLYHPTMDIMINGNMINGGYFYGTIKERVKGYIIWESQSCYDERPSLFGITHMIQPGNFIMLKANALTGYKTERCNVYLWRTTLEKVQEEYGEGALLGYDEKTQISTAAKIYCIVCSTKDVRVNNLAKQYMQKLSAKLPDKYLRF